MSILKQGKTNINHKYVASRDLRKCEGKSKLTTSLCQIAPHGCIIGILLYNNFIELLGSNQTFGKSKDCLNFPGHVKQGEKNMLHNA